VLYRFFWRDAPLARFPKDFFSSANETPRRPGIIALFFFQPGLFRHFLPRVFDEGSNKAVLKAKTTYRRKL
jgi:hypothetical protein